GRALWKASGLFKQADWYPQSWQPELEAGVYDYRITQEGNNKKWLFGLRGIAAMEKNIGMTKDDRLISKKKVSQRKNYLVRSAPNMKIAPQGLSDLVRDQSVQLQQSDQLQKNNQKSHQLAQQILLENDSDRARMEAMLQYYRLQEFSYTLQPEQMKNNDIDQFLFSNRAGFCAHFASSFVFIMRTMKIPARIVAGYQGGELNPDSGHITVRQYDAHAWAEVWLAGEGWVSVDPTAQVAPDRITAGLRNALKEDEFMSDSQFSLIKLSHLPWLNSLRLSLDNLNYQWHQSVLNFNKQKQSSQLKKWFGQGYLEKSLYWLIGLFIAIFFASAGLLLWTRAKLKLTPLQKSLLYMDKRLSIVELQRKESEGFSDYSLRLQLAFPQHKKSIQRLFEALQQQYFADQSAKQALKQQANEERRLSQQLRKLAQNLGAIAKNKSSLRQ
ncbi:hypothetical protein A9R00_10305, partial [Oleispira antarctica]